MSGDGRDGSSDSWHNLSTVTVTGIQCSMLLPPPLSQRSCRDCEDGRPNDAIKHILPLLCCYSYQYWPLTCSGQMGEEVDINVAGDIMFHVSSHSRPWEGGWFDGCSAPVSGELGRSSAWWRTVNQEVIYWILAADIWTLNIPLVQCCWYGYQFAQSPVVCLLSFMSC